MSATARSCSSGVISIGVAPRSSASPSTTARSDAGVSPSRHTTHGRPTKMSARAEMAPPRFATGERVRADVVGEVDPACPQRVQRFEFDARDVGDDGARGGRAALPRRRRRRRRAGSPRRRAPGRRHRRRGGPHRSRPRDAAEPAMHRRAPRRRPGRAGRARCSPRAAPRRRCARCPRCAPRARRRSPRSNRSQSPPRSPRCRNHRRQIGRCENHPAAKAPRGAPPSAGHRVPL